MKQLTCRKLRTTQHNKGVVRSPKAMFFERKQRIGFKTTQYVFVPFPGDTQNDYQITLLS